MSNVTVTEIPLSNDELVKANDGFDEVFSIITPILLGIFLCCVIALLVVIFELKRKKADKTEENDNSNNNEKMEHNNSTSLSSVNNINSNSERSQLPERHLSLEAVKSNSLLRNMDDDDDLSDNDVDLYGNDDDDLYGNDDNDNGSNQQRNYVVHIANINDAKLKNGEQSITRTTKSDRLSDDNMSLNTEKSSNHRRFGTQTTLTDPMVYIMEGNVDIHSIPSPIPLYEEKEDDDNNNTTTNCHESSSSDDEENDGANTTTTSPKLRFMVKHKYSHKALPQLPTNKSSDNVVLPTANNVTI